MSRSLKYIILLCYFCVTILLFENSVRDSNDLTIRNGASKNHSRALEERTMFSFSSQSIPLSHSERRPIISNADAHIRMIFYSITIKWYILMV